MSCLLEAVGDILCPRHKGEDEELAEYELYIALAIKFIMI